MMNMNHNNCHRPEYLDVYFSRVFHRGESVAEVAQNTGERSFESWLASSVHTVKDLSVERGLYFSGIILTDKDKEQQKIMYLNVANNIPIVVGDIVNWQCDGTIEKWIIFKKEKKVNGTYQTFSIVRCNYLMKWVDKNGHIQSSWSYFVSSMDSKIKENFRTWNALITPQPNKYAEMIIPKKDIERGTSFIVENESWSMVEYDHTSVPGIMYLSLTEEKVNYIYDDLENNIADTDKIANYEILLPDEIQNFNVGDEITPIFTISKNGQPFEVEVNYISSNKKIAKIINGKLTALKAGKVSIVVQLKDYPEIHKEIEINIGEQPIFNAYISGEAAIKLDRKSHYELISNLPLDKDVTYSLSDESLAFIIDAESNHCTIQANSKNKLGKVILIAEYNGVEYSKEIKIAPLW